MFLSIDFTHYFVCVEHTQQRVNHLKFLLLGSREKIDLTRESDFYRMQKGSKSLHSASPVQQCMQPGEPGETRKAMETQRLLERKKA